MSSFKSIIVTASAIGIAATLAIAGGHSAGPIEKAIKARKAQMTLYSFNLGILGAMAKGEMDYDAELAGQSAQNLAAAASLMMPTAWPQGSDNASVEGTRTLPAAWEKWPDIATKGQAMSDAAVQLAAVAGNDLESLRGAIGPVGAACGACHKAYRAEN